MLSAGERDLGDRVTCGMREVGDHEAGVLAGGRGRELAGGRGRELAGGRGRELAGGRGRELAGGRGRDWAAGRLGHRSERVRHVVR
jgi:hypothetical protein